MIKCKICNMEYEDHFERCPHCEAGNNSADKGQDDNWVILTTVANDIEFEMLAGLLEGAGIPAVRKVNGIDGYLTVLIGVPLAGVDVLVPKDKLEEAQQLLEANIDEDAFEK